MTKTDFGLFGTLVGVGAGAYVAFALLPKVAAFDNLRIEVMTAVAWTALALGGAIGYALTARPRAKYA